MYAVNVMIFVTDFIQTVTFIKTLKVVRYDES